MIEVTPGGVQTCLPASWSRTTKPPRDCQTSTLNARTN